ncbi:MFS transporter [Amycolatopsis benzoatilytica]|uniref:MFS transporter n=1 Tax=Amycolatopsis benzoatilytica TaxID=346045 RepID=UPI00037B3D76|nr:MFS transporter [Amycolatopsis benzoatilytica]
MTADVGAAPRTGGRPGTVLLVVSAAVFLASLDLFIVNIAFPDIRLAFPGTGLAGLSWILNGYTVAFAALLAPAGRLADRYGRRAVFLIGVAVFTAGSAACAIAPSVPLLVAFRVLQAVGAALVMPTSLALLLAAFPPARRAKAVSTWAAVGGVAAALGPPVGGVLVQFSWRWVFLVNLPVGLLALLSGPRVLRESRDTGSGMPDLPGAIALAAGVGALAWALVSAPDHGWGSREVLIGFAIAVLGLLAVVLRSRRHPTPVLDLPSLRIPTLWLSCLAMLLFTMAFGSMLFGNVLFLTGLWHESVVVAGLWLAPGPLMVVAVSLTVGGRLAGRFGPGVTVAIGSLLFVIGVATWVWRLGPAPDYVGGLLPGQLFTGSGVGLILPSLSGVVGLVLPPAKWGAGSSMINTARQIGTVLGTAVLVAIYGGTPALADYRHGWLFLIAAALGSALAAAAIATRRNFADHYLPPAPESWLTGRIRQPDATPLADTAVTILDSHGNQLHVATTGDDGTFQIPVLENEPALLVAARAGHRAEAVPLTANPASSLELVLRHNTARVSGFVHDDANTPVNAATVVLTDTAGTVVGSVRTGEDGAFSFEGLEPGALTLTATAGQARISVRSLHLHPGEHETIEVALPPAGRLTGVVHNGLHPVAGARVTLLDERGNAVAVQDTAESGRYEFPGLPSGRYEVVTTGFPPSTSIVRLTEHGDTAAHDVTLRHEPIPDLARQQRIARSDGTLERRR